MCREKRKKKRIYITSLCDINHKNYNKKLIYITSLCDIDWKNEDLTSDEYIYIGL